MSGPQDFNSPSLNSARSGQFFMGLIRGVAGAIVGGAVGYFAFWWLWTQGFYSVILPGALLGLGFGIASRTRSFPMGVFCGIAAIVFGLLSEWMVRPFSKDESLGYFLQNLDDLSAVTFFMIGFGGLMAFWFGRGR